MKKINLLDKFLPEYHFSEEHAVLIQAPPPSVFAAIKQLTPAELSPLIAFMLFLRNLPARLFAKPDKPIEKLSEKESFLDQLLSKNFIALGEIKNQEIVFGMIGQFWKISPKAYTKVKKPDQFIKFQHRDYAKVVANLLVSPGTTGKTRCSTITRIQVTDPATRRKFALYWMIISLGSGVIRMLWLNAIKRKAEQGKK